MYILYAIEFPARPLARESVEKAWNQAGVGASWKPPSSATLGPAQVESVVLDALKEAGASRVSDRNRDMEIPDSALELLQSLEEFYHRLYPETRDSGRREHFQYEKLEWLGQY